MALTIVTTEDVPQSNERLTTYANHYVVLVPIPNERETTGQTRFGERPRIRVQAFVYKEGAAYDLGIVPVFQGSIRGLIAHASSHNSVVAGQMTKVDNRWTFVHDEKNKEHVKALDAISEAVAASDPFAS